MAQQLTEQADLPENGLDKQGLLTAITALSGANVAGAAKLRKVVSSLMDRTDNWSSQVAHVHQSEFPAYYLKATLGEILDLPGNIALIRLFGGGYLLMRRFQQRWQTVNQIGEVVADVPLSASDAHAEAVVFRISSQTSSEGLDSLKALWPALRGAWAEVGIASFLINAGLLLLPLFSMLVYDKVVSNGVFETLWALTIGMLVYLLTDTAMRMVRAWSTERVAEDLTRKSDESLWKKLVAQKDIAGGFARFLANYRDLSVSRDFVSSTYLLTLADLPFLLLYLLVIGIIAWPLLIVASILVILYAIVGFAMQLRTNRLAKESEQHNTRKLTFMGEVLGALDVVRTVPRAGTFLRRWLEFSDTASDIDSARRLATSHTSTLAAGMLTLSTVAMLAAGAYLIEARALSVGGLIACNLLAARAMSLVTSLFMVVGKWQDFKRAAQRMEGMLETDKVREFVPRNEVLGNLALIGLTKAYPERPVALDNITLNIAAGERVALLGRPGAGKTTLLRCLAGLSKLDAGQILVDGLSLEDIAPFDRAHWLAWKSQDPALFAGTLEDNLTVSGSNVNSERFLRALWASGLEDEFKSGRLSLGMQIEERGSNLSGGQRQKVALARTFAQPCRILLLDEPTLGLDPDSERLLADRLPQLLSAQDILIMTTHSAIMLGVAQRVIAIDAGKVVADGPREKLLRVG